MNLTTTPSQKFTRLSQAQGGAPYYRKLGEQDAVDPARKRKRAVPQNYKLAYVIGWYEAKKNANATLPGKPFHPGETLYDDTCAG